MNLERAIFWRKCLSVLAVVLLVAAGSLAAVIAVRHSKWWWGIVALYVVLCAAEVRVYRRANASDRLFQARIDALDREIEELETALVRKRMRQ